MTAAINQFPMTMSIACMVSSSTDVRSIPSDSSQILTRAVRLQSGAWRNIRLTNQKSKQCADIFLSRRWVGNPRIRYGDYLRSAKASGIQLLIVVGCDKFGSDNTCRGCPSAQVEAAWWVIFLIFFVEIFLRSAFSLIQNFQIILCFS